LGASEDPVFLRSWKKSKESDTHVKSLHADMSSLSVERQEDILFKIIHQKPASSVLLQYIDESKTFPVDFVSSLLSPASIDITDIYTPISRTKDAVLAWEAIFAGITEHMNDSEQLLRHSIQVFLTTLLSRMEHVQSHYVKQLILILAETFTDMKKCIHENYYDEKYKPGGPGFLAAKRRFRTWQGKENKVQPKLESEDKAVYGLVYGLESKDYGLESEEEAEYVSEDNETRYAFNENNFDFFDGNDF
jgi:hypothetical protein